jgi:hypothetical protein
MPSAATKKVREFFAHPIIQMALAAGASILTLAYFSKRVLPEPLSNLELALPPFLATVFEGLAHRHRGAWYARPSMGIAVVVISTLLIIVFNL